MVICGLRLGICAVQVSSPGKRQLLGDGVEQQGRLEGLIGPDEQVAIDEQLLAQERGEIR